jgi:hypothetical protein
VKKMPKIGKNWPFFSDISTFLAKNRDFLVIFAKNYHLMAKWLKIFLIYL